MPRPPTATTDGWRDRLESDPSRGKGSFLKGRELFAVTGCMGIARQLSSFLNATASGRIYRLTGWPATQHEDFSSVYDWLERFSTLMDMNERAIRDRLVEKGRILFEAPRERLIELSGDPAADALLNDLATHPHA